MKRLVLISPILFLMIAIVMISCGYGVNNGNKKTIDFSHLKKTNRIKVTIYNVNDKGNEKELCETRMIDDPMRVKEITSNIQSYTHNWQHAQFSPPWTSSLGRLSPILITFYKNEVREATLTIGHLDGFGYYLQCPVHHLGRRLSVEELEDLLSFLEIDQEVVHNQTPCN